MKPSEALLSLGKPVAFYPALVPVLGSVNAALFFCQVLFHMGKEMHPDLGVYKSRLEIEEETGLTYEEQLKARELLKKKHVLVETHVRQHHRVYFRLNLAIVRDLTGEQLGKTKLALGKSLTGSWQKPNSYIQEKTTEITTEKKKPEQKALGLASTTKNSLTGSEADMNSSEILNKHKNALLGDKNKKSLQGLWQRKMGEITGTFQHAFAMKDLGMLKQLKTQYGDRAYEVVEYAMDNWWKFSQRAKAADGLKEIPGRPMLWFFVKYRQIAYEVYLQSIANPEPEPQPIAKAATKPASKPVVEPAYKPSPEVLEALLAWDGTGPMPSLEAVIQ
jgi:hypothetical protein